MLPVLKHTARNLITCLLVLTACALARRAFGAAYGKSPVLPAAGHGMVRAGGPAPGFSGRAVDGSMVSIDQYRGHAVLLSFIDIRDFKRLHLSAEVRSQLTFLKSIYRQYAQRGLTIVLVDVPGLRGNSATAKDVLINFIDDHGLQGWPLLSGKAAGEVAARYGVRMLPTSVLVNPEGRISQVWERLALSSQLALAMDDLFASADSSGSWDTPSQTVFRGLGPARPLSRGLWMVDEGGRWRPAGYPVRLIALDDRARRVRLTAINASGEKVLIDTAMERIKEGGDLLHNMPGAGSSVYSSLSLVFPGAGGRYELKAAVFDQDNRVILRGTARVTVADR